MSYLVLARKYRPQKIADLVGQEHIVQLLTNAIETGKVAHAYLFCGPRGVGKTSSARILAKSLNCEQGPTLSPCEKCSACLEITKGSSFDVIEIDGASNRGIDEIRTLRENVKFAPSYGRYKIYIVDEVHMLTSEAFNALLKTLEEPPPHAKFIFATTSVEKVPSTILSRCQRFDFKRIPFKTIIEHLTELTQKEKINIDQDALYAIAKSADGSMRDALSILDQMGVIHERQIKANDVYTMLGQVEITYLFELTKAVAEKNSPKAFEIFEKIVNSGKDIRQLNKDLTNHFRNLMIVKIGGKTLSKLIDYAASTKDLLLEQSNIISLSEILKTIDYLIEAQERGRITDSDELTFELALAKLTYSEGKGAISKESIKETVKEPTPQTKAASPGARFTSANVLKSEKGEIDMKPSQAEKQKEEAPAVQNLSFTLEQIQQDWSAFTHAVSREKMSLATYLQEGVPIELSGHKLVIGFPQKCKFQKESLENQSNIKFVENIFSEKIGHPISLQYRLVDETPSLGEETHVKSVLDTFNGKVISRWHNE
jgi:DNA polymerase III subunit gamma/tau